MSSISSIPSDDPDNGFRFMANFAPVMMWETGTDKLAKWLNKSWLDYTGRSIDQEIGLGWTEVVHADDIDNCLKLYEQAFSERKPFSIDYRLLRHDGVYRWVSNNGAPKYAADGSFTGYIGCCLDIQEHKDLELALSAKTTALEQSEIELRNNIKESESRKRLYETILSATPDFVYTFEFGEDSHRFGYANEGLLKMFGRTYEDTVGKTFLEIGYEPWHAELHNREIDLVRSTKQPLRGEVPFNGTHGRRIYDYIFSPVFNSNGEVEAVAGITRDVTERHNTEEILKRNEETLLQASQRKDEFLAMLAHELRNPLAPISAATQIMALSNYEEGRVRKFSQVIERQVTHMVGLVDDLLDVSRVTRGLVEIQKSPQDINAVIANSIEQVRPFMDSKNHELRLDLVSDPVFVMGDHKRLVQIISNVLNNAVRYTQEKGQINLEMKVEDNLVVINISDNGIGITAEDQEIIFELFTQAKRSSDRSQGGLGIGLALVQSMLKLHDGTITCFSAGLGQGSQFTITLPLWAEQIKAQSDIEPVKFEKKKSLSIIVVDDNVDAAVTLADLLKLNGHHVAVEHDSKQALKLINEKLPHVCILDIGLPEMDGNELAQHIKANPKMDKTVLIAVTGYGQESDRKKALASGFNHHLVKPVDYDKLLKIIKGLAEKLNESISKRDDSNDTIS
ncbi:MAG TPA: ATP-binding protein [Methylotenera sp.]|nr:ATP-binding protein [Methylotenera sp.]